MMVKEKGFTLLEVILAIMLFGILLEGIGGFFSGIYKEFTYFDTKVVLNNEATAIEDFMRDYIRMADEIKIFIKRPTITDPIQVYPQTNSSTTISGETLSYIEIVRKTQTTASGGGIVETVEKCNIQLEGNKDKGQGSYKLYYVVKNNGVENKRVISDQIENIKIAIAKDSNLVEIECMVGKENETDPRLKTTVEFTESLAYK